MEKFLVAGHPLLAVGCLLKESVVSHAVLHLAVQTGSQVDQPRPLRLEGGHVRLMGARENDTDLFQAEEEKKLKQH